MKKKICIVTGTRAEYGLLKPLIKEVSADTDFVLQLVVTGMHLSKQHGATVQEIEKDGFNIDYKVKDGLEDDSAKAITASIGQAMIGFADVFAKAKPDIVLVLGDRTEILAATTAAMIATIPVAHIHGGETTEGAYDEFIRHAITKMSHLHFSATAAYRNRIIQLGEAPSTVYNVGAIGIDSIRQLPLLDKNEFEKSIDTKLKDRTALITFHPVTLENASAGDQFANLLEVLDGLDETTLIFTKPNSDKNGRIISKMIDEYVENNTHKAVSFHSLGQLRYLSAMQFVDFVIGNSSSGIIEVPYFNIPTINIGDRQRGRITPKSVIHCKPNVTSIQAAVQKAVDKKFRKSIATQEQLYGKGYATQAILSTLKNHQIKTMKKPFFNLDTKCFEKL